MNFFWLLFQLYYFRSNITNPQVKNTVTFKTLTYEISLLGILSTLFLCSHDTENTTKINKIYILIVLNMVNIVSNIFLFTYLVHNQEALEYTKMKNREYVEKLRKMFRGTQISPTTTRSPTTATKIFTIKTPKRDSLIQFKNDIELVEMESGNSIVNIWSLKQGWLFFTLKINLPHCADRK